MKELMDKAHHCLRPGQLHRVRDFREARPWRSIPTSWPPRCWSSKPRRNDASSKTFRPRMTRKKVLSPRFQQRRHGGHRRTRKSRCETSSYAKDFKDLTQEPGWQDERQARAPQRPEGHGQSRRSSSERISINMDKQPLGEAVTFLHELHRPEHRARSQGGRRRGAILGVTRDPGDSTTRKLKTVLETVAPVLWG